MHIQCKNLVNGESNNSTMHIQNIQWRATQMLYKHKKEAWKKKIGAVGMLGSVATAEEMKKIKDVEEVGLFFFT